jgi:hypothetical protein
MMYGLSKIAHFLDESNGEDSISKKIDIQAENFLESQDDIIDQLRELNERIMQQISMMRARGNREELEEKEQQSEQRRTSEAILNATVNANSSKEEGSFGKAFGASAGKGLGVGAGLAGIGAGIAGFMAAIAAGGKITEWIDTDMSALKNVMVTVAEAFDEMPVGGFLKMGALLAAGGVAGSLFGIGGAIGGTVGMIGIGVGVAGFLGALAGMGAAAEKFGTDGSKIKDIMTNVSAGLNAFKGEGLTTLAALLVPGALFGAALGVGAVSGGGLIAAGAGIGVPVGLALVGAGLAGFLGAFAGVGKLASWIGDDGTGIKKIMINVGAGLKALPIVNAEAISKIAHAIVPLAKGMSMLFAEQGLGMIRDLNKSVKDFLFGSESEDSIFDKLAKGLESLGSVSPDVIRNITPLSAAVRDLGAGLTDISKVDMGDFNNNIVGFGESMAEAIPLLSDIYNGTDGETRTYDMPGMMNKFSANFGDGLKSVPMELINTKLNQFPITDAVNQGTMEAFTSSNSQNVTVVNAPQDNRSSVSGAGAPAAREVMVSPVSRNASTIDAYTVPA